MKKDRMIVENAEGIAISAAQEEVASRRRTASSKPANSRKPKHSRSVKEWEEA